VERVPVGVAVLDRLYLIDDEGTFLDEVGPRYGDLAPPLVRGIADEAGVVVVERTELAGRVLIALSEDERLESAVSEIDVSGGVGSVRIHLRYPPITILMGEDGLVDRLREMLPLSEAIMDRFPALVAVDLRYEGRVYLQLAPGGLEGGVTALEPAVNGGR
jgi:hypothetical protein